MFIPFSQQRLNLGTNGNIYFSRSVLFHADPSYFFLSMYVNNLPMPPPTESRSTQTFKPSTDSEKTARGRDVPITIREFHRALRCDSAEGQVLI